MAGELKKNKNWHKKASPFGAEPFGAGELSSKVRTQPYGNLGGDSRFGLFEPSSGQSHANDYFSESNEAPSIEERLELLKEKKRKRKKRKENNKKISSINSNKQLSLVEGNENFPQKYAQWGMEGPKLPYWKEEHFRKKFYDVNKEKINQPSRKVKKTGLETELNQNNNFEKPKKSEDNFFKKVLNSSVTINSTDGELSEIGSGFFVNENMVLTCFHVVSPSGNTDTPVVNIKINNRKYFSKIYAFDSEMDIALLIIEEDYNSENYLSFHSQETKSGDEIIIVGTPLGFENLISDGIISSNREYVVEEGGSSYIFVSADISPGSSGGPVVCREKGAIVGMAAAIVSRGKDISGLNAAIPSSKLMEFLDDNAIKYNKI